MQSITLLSTSNTPRAQSQDRSALILLPDFPVDDLTYWLVLREPEAPSSWDTPPHLLHLGHSCSSFTSRLKYNIT